LQVSEMRQNKSWDDPSWCFFVFKVETTQIIYR
jgi:hypothetical protein